MSKVNVLEGMLKAIFPILFNAVFFILGRSEPPASVWISYAFVHIAYISILVTPYLVRKGKSAVVFGYALFTVSYTYFLIELVAGVIFILVAPPNFRVAFLVQLCLAGIYGAIFISNMLVNENTAVEEERYQPQIDYMKNARMEMAAIVNSISDRETRRKLEKAYDAINASQANSHPRVAALESEILEMIASLRHSVRTTEQVVIPKQVEMLLQMINERNRQLRQ